MNCVCDNRVNIFFSNFVICQSYTYSDDKCLEKLNFDGTVSVVVKRLGFCATCNFFNQHIFVWPSCSGYRCVCNEPI